MRSIATCYSEHAIKVSDSYCSGPSTRPTTMPRSLIKRPAPSSITSTYKIAKGIFAAVNWSGGHGFSFSITDNTPPPNSDSTSSSSYFRRFGKLKGSKEFQACGSNIELFWNLSLASYYDSGPEPASGFYIVVLVDSQPALFLGDVDEIEEEGELEFNAEIKRAEFSPISRIEKFGSQSGSSYSTRAQFSKVGEAHDVAIRFGSGEDGQKDPAAATAEMMSVWIDGRKAFQVKRLRWNFRGNQTVFLDGILVDVMWDLHGWFETGDHGNGGVFMFRTRSGFDSRLWLDEKKTKDPERDEFSLLICLTKDHRR